MIRARAKANATREVSMVIQRRPPLFGHVYSSARTARRVEDKVARVGRHHYAALNYPSIGLDHVDLRICES